MAIQAQNRAAKKYPSAVLVQLRAERNRANALIKAKKYEELEAFRADANKAMMATIRDFWDHFSVRPVYFYMDTNYDAVMAKHFDGVLMDGHLAQVHNPVISDTSTDYIIVYYGDPVWQTNKGSWDTTKAATMGGKPNGKALVINDDKLRQVSYISTIDFDFFNFKKKNAKNPYRFVSKKFNISYMPCAAELNRRILYKDK